MTERQVELVLPAGHTLAVRVLGSGRPIMLVHGFPLDSTIWQKQFDALVQHGFQVIAPDLRGFGDSSPVTGPMTMADLAEDLDHVRSVLVVDRPMALVGLSMGGYVALEYWKRYASSLDRLILTDTKPTADDHDAQKARYAMAERALDSTTWEAVEPMLEKLLSPDTLAKDAEITQWVKQMMARVPEKTIAAALRAMAERHDFSGELPSIRVPTLVMAGEHDAISPPNANRTWAAKIPGAAVVIVQSAGHLPQIENSERFNEALLRFL